MADRRLLPQHFKVDGKPKVAFATEEAAKAAAASVQDNTRAYLCDFCGHWHIGRMRRHEIRRLQREREAAA